MAEATIETVVHILDQTYPTLPMHEVHGHDPFQMLVAVILSQRARDSVTVPTAKILFDHIHSPQELLALPQAELEKIITPIGFPVAKAKALQKLAKALIETHNGMVPTTEAELLALPQVGRKTANIILTTFFDTPQIAVDIHVHRITNRLGWIQTKKVEDTERQLTKIIPKRFHPIVNRVFVAHGQQICLPRNPKCTHCPVEKYCMRIGIDPLQSRSKLR